MSTPADQVDTDNTPQGALAQTYQAPDVSPAGRAWGESYLKAHPEGVDTTGEAAILQRQDADAQEARTALQKARERLASQRMDPSVLGLRFAQAMMSPSRYGIPDQWGKAAGAVADWRQQNQEFQQHQDEEDVGLAEKLAGVDKQSLNARLALQELKERTQAQLMGTALKATANPPKPTGGTPHYVMSEHDVTMPDGTPGKQIYMLDSSSGKVVPYGAPTAGGKGAGLDSRSGALFQRVLSSANEATAAIDNITNLPFGASSGILGVGASPGVSWLAATKGVLTNKLAPQEVQSYMTMLPGLAKNLAMVESGGLQTAQGLNDVFGKLELREGDTGYTKLHKLAEYRQVVEKGIEPYLHNPKIPPEQKEEIQTMIDGLRNAVPFSHNDVTGLERAHAQNPELTLQQYIASQGLTKQPSSAAPAAGSAKAAGGLPPAALKQLEEGHVTTFANGQKWTLHNGQPAQVP
jgi:hypothetical protein